MLSHSEQTLGRKVLLRAIGVSGSSEEEQPTHNAARNTEGKASVFDWKDLYSKLQGTINSFSPVVLMRAKDTEEKGFVLDSKDLYSKFQGTINSFPPVVLMMKRYGGSNLLIGFCIATAILVIAVRARVVRKSRQANPGSVADLVRRGHLRSDRRGISSTLKYDDPFNNPLVKVGKGNSTVEMCGKVYRLAPVTLTREQQATHQRRRSRAYQWKRPTVFLKEGDSIPPDVDPDTIRWIPANHPFATTVSDIDENLAQNNVYQKHGVPFRIQAEHDALQKKLEALQNDEKLNNLMIDGRNAKDFQRPFKLYPEESPRSEHDQNSSSQGDSSSEGMQNP